MTQLMTIVTANATRAKYREGNADGSRHVVNVAVDQLRKGDIIVTDNWHREVVKVEATNLDDYVIASFTDKSTTMRLRQARVSASRALTV